MQILQTCRNFDISLARLVALIIQLIGYVNENRSEHIASSTLERVPRYIACLCKEYLFQIPYNTSMLTSLSAKNALQKAALKSRKRKCQLKQTFTYVIF
jgi:hypothetical protein